MNSFISIVFALALASVAQACEDWRINAFLSAQAIFEEFNQKEASYMRKVEPETAAFYDLWIPMETALRKREIIAFRHKLEHSPDVIDWSNVYLWSQGTTSTEEEAELLSESEEYAKAHGIFTDLRDELRSRKDLFRIRNEAYERNKKKMKLLESEVHENLIRLHQQKVKGANQAGDDNSE